MESKDEVRKINLKEKSEGEVRKRSPKVKSGEIRGWNPRGEVRGRNPKEKSEREVQGMIGKSTNTT